MMLHPPHMLPIPILLNRTLNTLINREISNQGSEFGDKAYIGDMLSSIPQI
jgi:hypothetical protein